MLKDNLKKYDRFRFVVIAVILFLMWLGIMGLLYLKADEVTKQPCSVCAYKMGENVICYMKDSPIKRTYFTDGLIIDDVT